MRPLILILSLVSCTAIPYPQPGRDTGPRLIPQVYFTQAARDTLENAWRRTANDPYQVERAYCAAMTMTTTPSGYSYPVVYSVVPAITEGASPNGIWRVRCDDDPRTSRLGGRRGVIEPGPVTAGIPRKITGSKVNWSRTVLIHTHPPNTCEYIEIPDASASILACRLGGEDAYICSPSKVDQLALLRSSRVFAILHCDEHAFVPYWHPNAHLEKPK